MPTPDDRRRRRARRRARRAWIRARIVGYLRDKPGWHGAGNIADNACGLDKVDSAEVWPELRRLVDRGMIVVSYGDLVEPCHGFQFVTRVPIFAHWRQIAPRSRPSAGGGGRG